MKMSIRKITVCAVLIALGVVLAELVPAVKTPIVQISFYFVPIIIAAMLYGPGYSVVVAALIDVVGTLLFGVGAFNPLFTLTAALNGLLYGVFLHTVKVETTIGNIVNDVRTAFENTILITVLLNTLNIALITYVDKGVTLGERFAALVPTRIFQAAVMFPLQAVIIVLLRQLVLPRLRFISESAGRPPVAA